MLCPTLSTAHLAEPLVHVLCVCAAVKSDNVLLGEYEGQLVAKVADFGTARYVPALLDENNSHHSTQIVIGTRAYMVSVLLLPAWQLQQMS